MNFARSAFLGSSAAALLAPLAARAQNPGRSLRLIFFPGADMLPVYIGVQKGFFARENVAVTLTPTPGSVYQFQHLSAGDFDIALTAIDNAIAYDEGQGEAPLPNPADFVAILGGDSAFLRLYARPEIATFADLKGKTLAVDAVTTGFAFVLRAMLEKNGVTASDVTLQPLGGTPARFAALVAGSCAATILNAPFDLQADARGMHQLGNVVAAIGPYQGVVSVVRKPWLAQNLPLATSYVRAMIASLRWMYDPANAAEATALLVDAGKMPPPVAAAMLPVLTAADGGMARTGKIDLAGVKTVLELRSRYGRPQKTLTDPLRYYDDRAYQAGTLG
jgi:ABC-type nitrate/sulfonate/bicarbonate transport system substrate-binding protein